MGCDLIKRPFIDSSNHKRSITGYEEERLCMLESHKG